MKFKRALSKGVFSGTRAAVEGGLSTVDSFELDQSFKYVPLDQEKRKKREELSGAMEAMRVNR
jgi:hypothetical protein